MSLPENPSPSTKQPSTAAGESANVGFSINTASQDRGPPRAVNATHRLRTRRIVEATLILVFVGILNVLGSLALMIYAEQLVEDTINQQSDIARSVGRVRIDPGAVAQGRTEAVLIIRTMFAVYVVAGLLLIGIGMSLVRGPVAMASIGLVLYVVACGLAHYVEPREWFYGILVKGSFVIALIEAVIAAYIYEKNTKPASPVVAP